MVETLLANLTLFPKIFIYSAIFFGMFIEGEIILILAGILLKTHHIHFLQTFAIAFAGVVLHDIFYWFLGKEIAKTTNPKFLFVSVEKIKNFLNHFKKFNAPYIFISKFGYSINRFMLAAGGYFNVPFKKLIKYSIPADFIWVMVFLSLGYLFAGGTAILKKDLKLFAVFVTIFLLVVIVAENLVQKAIEKKEYIEE